MRYLIIDGALSGTGVRDKYETGDVELVSLELTDELIERISNWLHAYEEEHYAGFKDLEKVESLDQEGVAIAKSVKNELGDVKVEYLSDATMKRTILE